ncbi:BF3164 family lipoprotein [Algoriphagus hitonicola]|uniref:TolB-like 6-blade propeller-like n=1 Tax=Algoriphagus hitonicola TaxID=435880 RepID=A0A1I2QH61_9BACT|nr:BF3164 family lipoprotein [Algoriphagus hitonicola]SFG27742.1 TolB-like 6-blade propeller-like [Algoriphagus hitonicola]
MKNSILLLTCFLFASCAAPTEEINNRTITWDDFEIIQINSEKHYFEEIINPSSIGFNRNKIILTEAWRVPENFPRMHLIDVKDWTYDKPKGKYGKGPLEISDVAHLLKVSGQDEYWVYNLNARKLVRFSTTDSSLLGRNEWKLPKDMPIVRFIENTKEGSFLAIPREGDYILEELDSLGNSLGSYGKWDSIPERPELTSKDIAELNTGWFKGNPEENLFVFATLYRDILKMFDYQTKEFITILGPNLELPLFDLHKTAGPSVFVKPESTYRYRDVVISTDYIFALYGGYSYTEFTQTGKIAEDILVFDHSGNPLWNLKLDRSIIEMVFDENTNQLYGLTVDEDPGIAVFDLPEEILKE